MRSKLLNADPPITYAVVLDTGDEVTGELGKFVREVAPAPCSRRRGNGLRGRRLGPFDCTLCTAQRRWVTERSFDRIDDLLAAGFAKSHPNEPATVTPERHPPPTQQPLERRARIRAAR
jgi:hypothetical protein